MASLETLRADLDKANRLISAQQVVVLSAAEWLHNASGPSAAEHARKRKRCAERTLRKLNRRRDRIRRKIRKYKIHPQG